LRKQKNRLSKKPDYILIGAISLLLTLGLVILISASGPKSYQEYNQAYYYFRRQLLYGLLAGLILLLIVQKIPYCAWQKVSVFFFLFSLLLMGLVFVPGLGVRHGGAARWIRIGSFSFQPSEIFKLSLIIFLAVLLEKRKSLWCFLLVVGISSLFFIFQPDVGTFGLIFVVCCVLYFTSGAKLSHLAAVILIGLIGFGFLIKMKPYRFERLMVFLHPEKELRGAGYQVNQALLALGSGGWHGLGLGHSQQKYQYLPAVITDSIFAILGEELGFVGAIVLLALFVLLALRGFRIAQRAPDMFGSLLAYGITCWFVFQAFLNIMAITGLLPLTGIPLPFISYGCSAMIVSLVGVGILLNISKYASY
jgi:cell division protein FtsW